MKIFKKLLSIFIVLGFSAIHSIADESEVSSSEQKNLIAYNHPAEEGQIRRREAGVAPGGDASEVRGVTRGVQRGSVRGVNRGVQRGVARGAVRGVSRGGAETGELLPLPKRMEPLSPQSTAYTSKTQPVLYFYLSDPTSDPINFTLNSEEEVEPVILEDIVPDAESGKTEAGIHAIDLSQYDVELKPDVEYEWFVSIILDERERSSDFLASATIKYMESSTDLQEALAATGVDQRYVIYAKSGYWYDAIEALNEAIETQPENAFLGHQLAAWLEKLKLPATLAYVQDAQKE